MKRIGILILTIGLIGSANAQTKAKKGDYSFLKGEALVNIVFDYEGMVISRKKRSEEDYVNEKVEEHNKDEAGKGDKWKKGWYGAREERYEPKFLSLFNKELEKVNVKGEKGASAKYTLIVKTKMTEPGWNIGISKMPASADFLFIFKEGDKEIGKYYLDGIPGAQAMGYDFDAGSRIAECYAKAGKMLGKYIYKDLK